MSLMHDNNNYDDDNNNTNLVYLFISFITLFNNNSIALFAR